MGQQYSHLSSEERILIEKLHCEQHLSIRRTAERIGRDKSTAVSYTHLLLPLVPMPAWEQRKLGEIVSIGAGAPPSAFSAGNFLYVKVDDLNESSHFQFDSAQRVDANTAVKPIRKGSIIFAKRGAAILGNKVRVLGKTAYIDTNMMALEPRGVDADFLWLFINQTGLYRIADTSTIPQINNKHIEPYPVDIPNMAEQQAIGTFFSRLDDLITLHQRKLELLQDIKKSLLDKMFV